MNKRNLALLISKHPLIELLKKDKTLPNSVVARLIAEELLKEDIDALNKAIEGSEDEELKQLFQKFLETLESGDSSKIKYDGVVSKILFMVNQKKLNQAKQKLTDSIKAMAGQQQPQQDGDSQLKPLLDKFANFLNSGVLTENIEALIRALQPKDEKVFGDSFGENFQEQEIKVLKQYFDKKENIVLFVKQYYGNNPEKDQILKNVENALSAPEGPESQPTQAPAQEPESQPTQEPSEDPEVFDPEAEDLETLIATSKTLIDEFYDKDFLQEQGVLINAVLKQLAKIVEKEEQEKAARRSKKPEQPAKELQEQDQEPFSKKERRNIQIDLKSFLRLIKKAKAVLKKFDDLRNKGSIASS